MRSFKTSMSLLLGTLISAAYTGSAWALVVECHSDCQHRLHGAPGPVVGAGLPVILVAGVTFFMIRHLRQKRLARG
jgi:hypothetical protein